MRMLDYQDSAHQLFCKDTMASYAIFLFKEFAGAQHLTPEDKTAALGFLATSFVTSRAQEGLVLGGSASRPKFPPWPVWRWIGNEARHLALPLPSAVLDFQIVCDAECLAISS